MVCQFEITESELRAALNAIEKCKNNGFVESTAVFCISEVNKGALDVKAAFTSSVILKTDIINENKNWGNIKTDQINWYRYVDGVFESV